MIFKNFLNIKSSKIIKKDFLKLLKNQPALFETLKPTYKYSYSKKVLKKYKKLSNLRKLVWVDRFSDLKLFMIF